MQSDKGVAYYYKNSNGLSIYRFYKNGDVISAIYEENYNDVERLCNTVTRELFIKNKSSIYRYNYDGKNLKITINIDGNNFEISGILSAEDQSLILTFKNKKGGAYQHIYKKMGTSELTITDDIQGTN